MSEPTTAAEAATAPVLRRPKKPAQNPVLPEHRVIFKEHLHVWQEKLGLHSWRVNLTLKRPIAGAAADVECFHTDRLAKVRLAEDLGGSAATSENFEAFAVHELLHVLLAPLVDQENSGLEGDSLAAEEHRVIHTLQKLLTKTTI